MSQIDPTTVDVDNVIERIQAIRRGELPADNVSVEELRAALAAQRQRFTATAQAPRIEGEAKPKKVKSGGLIVPTLNLGL